MIGAGQVVGSGVGLTTGGGMTTGTGPMIGAGLVVGLTTSGVGAMGAAGWVAGVGIGKSFGAGCMIGLGGRGKLTSEARTFRSVASTMSRPRFMSNLVVPMMPTCFPTHSWRLTTLVTHWT